MTDDACDDDEDRKLNGKRIGTIGENVAATWASVHFTATPPKSGSDDKGWDLLLEEDASRSVPSLDLIGPHLRAFVQVKTSLGKIGRHQITIKNWITMVESVEPFFILFVNINEKGEGKAASLVHVHEKWITTVKKRCREMEPGESETETTISVAPTEEDALDPTDIAKALHDRIVADVKDVGTYRARKVPLLDTVGYDEFPYAANVTTELTLDSREQSQLFADFAVGLVTTIPVRRVDVSTVRFGITRPYEVREGPGMTMGYVDGPPYVPARVFFENKSGTRSASLPFKLHVSNIPDLPDDLWKARFASPLMEYFVLDRKEQRTRLRFNWPSAEGLPLAELDAWAQIIILFVSAKDDGVQVAYEWSGARQVGRGFHDSSVEFPDHAIELASAAEDAAYVAAHFRLPPDIRVSPPDIHEQARKFADLRCLFDRASGPFGIDVPTPGDDYSHLAGRPFGIAAARFARIGDQVVSAAVLYRGTGTWDEATETLGVSEGKLQVLGHPWVTPFAKFDKDELRARLKKLAGDVDGADDLTIFLPDGDD